MIFKVLGMFLLGVLCVDNIMAGTNSSFYKDGEKMGASFAKTVWRSFDTQCKDIDDFYTIVQETIDAKQKALRAKNRPSTFYDFNNGYIKGTRKVSELIADKCHYECRRIGRSTGQITARFFCDISKKIGKTAVINSSLYDKPAFLCGMAYRSGCEIEFYHDARSQCPEYAIGLAFDRYYKAKHNGVCSYTKME